jgi:hypothetical protein
MPLHFEDLEKGIEHGCQKPGCTHEHDSTLFFLSRCHPEGQAEVSYTKGTGELLVACGICHKEIARVAVARREPGQN